MNKYRNDKVCWDGQMFDSKKELNRWLELKLLERAGKISELERQITFQLIPVLYKDGKLAERACNYVADFVYVDTATGELVVEDTKGYKTAEYIIKRKLMLYNRDIKIREV